MKKAILLFIAFLLSTVQAPASGTAQEWPPEVTAVKKYVLENDYPELFNDNPYRTKIENIIVADIDNNGSNEVIAHYQPHYRQSPTIVFYTVSKSLGVTRITEGLAPGALAPVSEEQIDSHTLGLAIDFDIGEDQTNPNARKEVTTVSLAQFGGVVSYKNFVHADGRKGRATYINMEHIDLAQHTNTCENFQFSQIKQIAVGNLKSDNKRNYLAAWVGDEIYIYLIESFTKEGFIEKHFWVKKVLADFTGFAPGKALKYITSEGNMEIYNIGQ